MALLLSLLSGRPAQAEDPDLGRCRLAMGPPTREEWRERKPDSVATCLLGVGPDALQAQRRHWGPDLFDVSACDGGTVTLDEIVAGDRVVFSAFHLVYQETPKPQVKPPARVAVECRDGAVWLDVGCGATVPFEYRPEAKRVVIASAVTAEMIDLLGNEEAAATKRFRALACSLAVVENKLAAQDQIPAILQAVKASGFSREAFPFVDMLPEPIAKDLRFAILQRMHVQQDQPLEILELRRIGKPEDSIRIPTTTRFGNSIDPTTYYGASGPPLEPFNACWWKGQPCLAAYDKPGGGLCYDIERESWSRHQLVTTSGTPALIIQLERPMPPLRYGTSDAAFFRMQSESSRGFASPRSAFRLVRSGEQTHRLAGPNVPKRLASRRFSSDAVVAVVASSGVMVRAGDHLEIVEADGSRRLTATEAAALLARGYGSPVLDGTFMFVENDYIRIAEPNQKWDLLGLGPGPEERWIAAEPMLVSPDGRWLFLQSVSECHDSTKGCKQRDDFWLARVALRKNPPGTHAP